MNKDTLEKLIISKSNEDRFIAIEFLRYMNKEQIIQMLPYRKYDWYRHPNPAYTSPIRTGAIKVEGGYIAYNGIIWYAVDCTERILTDKGYKIVNSL